MSENNVTNGEIGLYLIKLFLLLSKQTLNDGIRESE